MRRFYDRAEAVPVEGGHGVALDGKKMKTPAGRALTLPSAALAEALAGEWQEQGETIDPLHMPLTQLAATAIDRITLDPVPVIVHLAGYAASDLLLYRAEAPEELAERQEEAWQPLLDWAAERFSAPLLITTGVVPIRQPPDSLARLRHALDAYDPWTLSVLQSVVPLLGSLILGLALVERRLDAARAFDLAQLDETWQEERWGSDHEARKRIGGLQREIEAAGRFLDLL